MSEAQSTENDVDTHDPAGMAQWLRERRDAALEFYKLDSEAQQRHFLQRWQQHVLPHLAFRFGQAATMVEQLSARVKWLEEWKDACEDTIARLNKKALHPDVAGDGKRKIGDACPACSARLGESQRQVRCANCGWLGTYTPQGG